MFGDKKREEERPLITTDLCVGLGGEYHILLKFGANGEDVQVINLAMMRNGGQGAVSPETWDDLGYR